MAIFGLNIFDNLTDGGWDEYSSCGVNKNCKKAKACIQNVCSPARALYGESVYLPCTQKCQRDPRPNSLDDIMCVDPKAASEVWGYNCGNYKAPQSGITLFGQNISPLAIGSFIVAIIILFILIF